MTSLVKDDPAPAKTALAREQIGNSVRAISLDATTAMRITRDHIDDVIRAVNDEHERLAHEIEAHAERAESMIKVATVISDALKQLPVVRIVEPTPAPVLSPPVPDSTVVAARTRRAAAAALADLHERDRTFEVQKIADKYGAKNTPAA